MRLAFLTVMIGLAASTVHAETSKVTRFDAVVRVLPGGVLEVTETIVFDFVSGTFDEVRREIPARRTDGVEVREARMDGGPSEVDVSHGSRVRVRFRFPPISSSSRTLTLAYVVRGAVARDDGADRLSWRVPGQEHRWAIDRADIVFELPGEAGATASVASSRTRSRSAHAGDGRVRLTAEGIRPNGWVETVIRLAPGRVIAAAPAWQQRARRANALAPGWIAAACVIFACGLVVLVALRQGYDAPPRESPAPPEPVTVSLPDSLAPALAGAVAGHGRVSIEHAMAALMTLAERGEVSFEQARGALGVRRFTMARRLGGHRVKEYEQAVLDVLFEDHPDRTVALGRARQKLTLRNRQFAKAVRRELLTAGLLDAGRESVRNRYGSVGIALIAAGSLGLLPAALAAGNYGAWPLLVPASILLTGFVALMLRATLTPLSNEGVARNRRWRALRTYLKAAARNPAAPVPVRRDDPLGELSRFGAPSSMLLPYAVALGAGSAWAKRLKREHASPPAWFHAAGDEDAFAAFAAAAGATADATHHAHVSHG